MDLKNKTVCFLGDSITEGVGATAPENCYVSLFAKAHPEAKVFNFGISGTRIAAQLKPSAKSRWDKYFASRIDDMPKSADLIFVFGGTNDYAHGDAPMGSFGDTEIYSFYGALYVLYTSLLNKYPDAKIVILTPLHTTIERGLKSRPDGDFTLSDYVDAIRECAEYFSLPIIDMWRISGMQPSVEIIKEKYLPDGLHPSDAGYKKIFSIIDSYVKSI